MTIIFQYGELKSLFKFFVKILNKNNPYLSFSSKS